MSDAMRRLWVSLLVSGAMLACGGADDGGGSAGTAGSAGTGGSGGAAGSGGTAGSAGTGGGAGSAGTGAGGSGGSAGGFTCSAGAISAGWNEAFKVGDQTRRFHAALPSAPSKPVSVIFNFHGYGDTAENMRKFFAPDPDADPDFPLVVVTPDDTGMTPFAVPRGLDWDLFEIAEGDDNREAALFEQVLGCLGQDFDLDLQRVYTFGFSAGAIAANMLHSRYPQHVGAVVAFSGAWFNDPDEVAGVNLLGLPVTLSWSELNAADGGVVLLSHGGPSDVFGAAGQQVIDFETSAGFAKPYLRGHGREVIDCVHTGGHSPHPQVTTQRVLELFKAHRAGEPAQVDLSGWPDSCARVD